MIKTDTKWKMRGLLFSVWVVIELPSMHRTLSVGGLEDKTLPWHILPGLDENVFEAELAHESQNVGHSAGPGLWTSPWDDKRSGREVVSH